MSATSSLFRREVRAAQLARAPGSVLLTGSRARRWLCALFSAVSVGVVLLLAFASHARTATVSGIVLPVDGIKRIAAAAPARVAAVLVSEGQLVAAGERLLSLVGRRTDGDGANPDALQRASLSARRASLQQELRQQDLQLRERHAAAARAVADQQQLLDQLAATLELQQRRVQLADGSLQRYRQLAAGGHIAALVVQEREAELLEQQQRLTELQRALLEARRQLHAAHAARAESQLQSEREQAAGERNLAALDQELAEASARTGWLVMAPVAGRVSAVPVQPGDEVTAGQLLLTLFNPAAPLVVELHAPSRAAGQLRVGQSVSLRFQAFPYQQFGQYLGTIQRISGNALQPEELAPEVAVAAARGGEALYRVSVRLATPTVRAGARELRLQPGMLVDASVRLESRRLYQWLLAPLADAVTVR